MENVPRGTYQKEENTVQPGKDVGHHSTLLDRDGTKENKESSTHVYTHTQGRFFDAQALTRQKRHRGTQRGRFRMEKRNKTQSMRCLQKVIKFSESHHESLAGLWERNGEARK